jgi:DNA-directed RNA polymerase subunit RPC12/RpoP
MTVEFVCDKCQKDNLTHPLKDGNSIVCPECSNEVAFVLSKGMQAGGKVDRCVICDHIRFYVQKDFNPRLGILIFILGVLFSYHTKFISLVVATAIDFILYKVLNTVTICYHCRAIYRGFEEDPTHRGFDHNLAMSLVEQEDKQNRASAEEATGVS